MAEMTHVVEALNRDRHLLDAVVRFIDRNPIGDYTVVYDEAKCDGECLRNDCEIQLDQIDGVLAQLAAKPPAVDRERRLREALENLVNKLTEIHGNSEYQSVWILSQMHNGPYVGPSYEGELNAAKDALADPPPPDPREAALDKAEEKLMWIWKNIPASTGLAYRAFYFTDSEVSELRTIVDEIRAARGKA